MFKWKYGFSLLWCTQCFSKSHGNFKKTPNFTWHCLLFGKNPFQCPLTYFLVLMVFFLAPLLFLGTPCHSKKKFHASFNIQLPNAIVIPQHPLSHKGNTFMPFYPPKPLVSPTIILTSTLFFIHPSHPPLPFSPFLDHFPSFPTSLGHFSTINKT